MIKVSRIATPPTRRGDAIDGPGLLSTARAAVGSEAKCNAARRLGELGPSARAAIEALTGALRDQDAYTTRMGGMWIQGVCQYHYVREEAARALIKIDRVTAAAEVVPVMIALLDKPSLDPEYASLEYVRFSPAEWKAVAGPALPHLLAAWRDGGPEVQQAAAEALSFIISAEPGGPVPEIDDSPIGALIKEFRKWWAQRRTAPAEAVRETS
jgi:hypothetical protein